MLVKNLFTATLLTAAACHGQGEAPSAIAHGFAYPVGKSGFATQARDQVDDWYNVQDFGENHHLGEDWNKNSGGNSDCGEPVFAAANGKVVFAAHAGAGWGHVVIIEHVLPAGGRVQTLYGHLRKILAIGASVKKRQQIGEVGNADGKYLCHLHFEVRQPASSMWSQPGPGYSRQRSGWLDPSDFIDRHR